MGGLERSLSVSLAASFTWLATKAKMIYLSFSLTHSSVGVLMHEVYTHTKHMVPNNPDELSFQVRCMYVPSCSAMR